MNSRDCLQEMAWLGADLVICTALRAMLLRLSDASYTPLFALPDDSPTALLVQPVPQAQLVLLLVVRPAPGGPAELLLSAQLASLCQTGAHCFTATKGFVCAVITASHTLADPAARAGSSRHPAGPRRASLAQRAQLSLCTRHACLF